MRERERERERERGGRKIGGGKTGSKIQIALRSLTFDCFSLFIHLFVHI